MLSSRLVDADFRDAESFYAKHKGERPDRDRPALAHLVDGLIARFDAHMASIAAGGRQPATRRLKPMAR